MSTSALHGRSGHERGARRSLAGSPARLCNDAHGHFGSNPVGPGALNRPPDVGSAPRMTPTVNSLPLRRADFASLSAALDYAAQGETGANFYAGSGKLATVLPYLSLIHI